MDEQLFPENIALRVEVYERHTTDPRPEYRTLIPELEQLPEESANNRFLLDATRGIARGIEFLLKRDVGRNLSLLLSAQAAAPSEAGREFAPPDVGPARALQQAWAMRMTGDDPGALRLARELARKHPDHPSVRAALELFTGPR